MTGVSSMPLTTTVSRTASPTWDLWRDTVVRTAGVNGTTRVVSGTNPHLVVTGTVASSPGKSSTHV